MANRKFFTRVFHFILFHFALVSCQCTEQRTTYIHLSLIHVFSQRIHSVCTTVFVVWANMSRKVGDTRVYVCLFSIRFFAIILLFLVCRWSASVFALYEFNIHRFIWMTTDGKSEWAKIRERETTIYSTSNGTVDWFYFIFLHFSFVLLSFFLRDLSVCKRIDSMCLINKNKIKTNDDNNLARA